MRLKDLAASHHQLLRTLTARVSSRLETEFTELPGADGPSLGVQLRERGKRSVMELPAALLLRAGEDRVVREKIRIRIKARRDRMLVRPEPTPLPRRLTPTPSPSPLGRGQGPGRYRR
jgi:hypothetical protein